MNSFKFKSRDESDGEDANLWLIGGGARPGGQSSVGVGLCRGRQGLPVALLSTVCGGPSQRAKSICNKMAVRLALSIHRGLRYRHSVLLLL